MPEASSPAALLDPQAVGRAEALGLYARLVVEGYMAGEHKSPFRGFATEFTQHREYVPGDDLRHLDWKVLGRTDRTYLKQYEQETNFVAHLLLDGSASMRYGSGRLTKLHHGKMLAACLAYVILRQRDAAALHVFDTSVRVHVPRADVPSRILPLLEALAAYDPKGETRLAPVLHDLARQVRRRGIVVLISDLFDGEEEILDGIRHLRFGGHEVIVFHVLDAGELEFPFRGEVEFRGLEESPVYQTRPADIREAYLREFEAFRTRIREGCERDRCHYVLVNTAQPLHEALSGYLALRRRAGRK